MKKTVLVLVDDLFWRSKIDFAVKTAEAQAVFASDPEQLNGVAPDPALCLVIADLSLRKPPFAWIAAFKKSQAAIPIIGFFEHVRKDLKEKALQSGCDQILPRSAFAEELTDLVMAHAMPGAVRTVPEEEHELPDE
ncbi:MAG: hypothetical protein IT186_12915 [Acidobacteria bacterium]|nr:hypothetical protein [Acidobacteriota bacterium]MCG3192137.1 hypothetical protein [Thermoanaerobaculia bacterium]MCK6683657.1 hypothetical protein [Thermoanaerobaculia bacterium]